MMKSEEILKEFTRTAAVVDLNAILTNLRNMKAKVAPHTKIAAVIKTDGYGHGACEIARILEQEDMIWGYAVAAADEAFQLRNAGIRKPILILGYTFSQDYIRFAEQDIRPAVFRADMIDALNEAAQKAGKTIAVHIKVDTGMSRIGVQTDAEGLEIVRHLKNAGGLRAEGIFTHFARADELDKTKAIAQLDAFTAFVEAAERELGCRIPIHHCSNSAGILEMPQANMDMVRAGITTYGLWPSDEVDRSSIELLPAMSLYTRVVHIKELRAGREISYGGTYKTEEARRVATICIGYGDGYPRSLSNTGCVLIHGKRCSILGRVCMDQMMVDVTDVPEIRIGDLVTLVGQDGDERITLEELGAASGRFNYELACLIHPRVPRYYVCGTALDGTNAE